MARTTKEEYRRRALKAWRTKRAKSKIEALRNRRKPR